MLNLPEDSIPSPSIYYQILLLNGWAFPGFMFPAQCRVISPVVARSSVGGTRTSAFQVLVHHTQTRDFELASRGTAEHEHLFKIQF